VAARAAGRVYTVFEGEHVGGVVTPPIVTIQAAAFFFVDQPQRQLDVRETGGAGSLDFVGSRIVDGALGPAPELPARQFGRSRTVLDRQGQAGRGGWLRRHGLPPPRRPRQCAPPAGGAPHRGW